MKVLAIIGTIVIVVLVGIAAWQFSWFVAEKNTDRQVRIDNRNTGTQTAWHDQATSDVRDFFILPDGPAQAHVRVEACDLIARLADSYVDDNLNTFQQENC